METTNPTQPVPEVNQNQSVQPKPPTLIGMVAQGSKNLSPQKILQLIKQKPLIGLAATLIFITIVLFLLVMMRPRPTSYFTVASPTPVPMLATPQPILSTVGKTPEFQSLEASLSAILDTVKNSDLSESQLAAPLLETNLDFGN